MKKIRIAIALASLVSAAAFADVVVLKDGKKVEGEIVEETDQGVTLKIPKAKIEKVEYSRPRGGKDGEKGDVSLWYTCMHEWGNNGVALRTSRHFLVFDHVFTTPPPRSKDARKGFMEGGKTLVPKDLEEGGAFFFFTHNHADHYNPAIKKLAGTARTGAKIHFIVPEYMKGEFREEKFRSSTTVLGHEETKEIDGVKVHSAFTGKGIPGCNYIVEADGLIFVYVNRCFEAAALPPIDGFLQRLGTLIGGRRVDVACVDETIQFPEINRPRLIVPVHFKGESQVILERFGKDASNVKLAIGDRFLIPGNKLRE